MRASATLKMCRKPQDTKSHCLTIRSAYFPTSASALVLCLYIMCFHLLWLLNKRKSFAILNGRKPQNKQQHCTLTSTTVPLLWQDDSRVEETKYKFGENSSKLIIYSSKTKLKTSQVWPLALFLRFLYFSAPLQLSAELLRSPKWETLKTLITSVIQLAASPTNSCISKTEWVVNSRVGAGISGLGQELAQALLPEKTHQTTPKKA